MGGEEMKLKNFKSIRQSNSTLIASSLVLFTSACAVKDTKDYWEQEDRTQSICAKYEHNLAKKNSIEVKLQSQSVAQLPQSE